LSTVNRPQSGVLMALEHPEPTLAGAVVCETMTTDNAEGQVSGIEMTAAEVDAFLTEQGYGTLSLASEGDSYGVPISFGYDGDSAYMHLIQFGEESRKLAYLAETETACLTVDEVEGRFRWRSVVARGPLEEVPESEVDAVEDALDDNGWVPTLFPPTDPMTDVRYLRLEIGEATGRKGQAYQD